MEIHIKSISKSEKMWNIFRKKWIFSEFFEISKILKNVNRIINWNIGKNTKFLKIVQKKQNLENISHFFTCWDGFFMDFQNCWCSVKRRCPLLIRILYLFMKCASKCSIIEIYRNGTKKVSFGWIFPIHLPFSSDLTVDLLPNAASLGKFHCL